MNKTMAKFCAMALGLASMMVPISTIPTMASTKTPTYTEHCIFVNNFCKNTLSVTDTNSGIAIGDDIMFLAPSYDKGTEKYNSYNAMFQQTLAVYQSKLSPDEKATFQAAYQNAQNNQGTVMVSTDHANKIQVNISDKNGKTLYSESKAV